MKMAKRLRKVSRRVGAAAVAAVLASASWVVPAMAADGIVGAEAIIQQILPRTRGIAVQETSPRRDRISLPAIQFEFDSARLTTAALGQMRELSKALGSDLLRSYSFSVQGHTDSVGAHAYNRSLSERRARTVKQYLVDTAGVAAHRLVEIGLGEDYPITGLRPTDDRNRRVEIVNLGGSLAQAPRPVAQRQAPGRRALLIGIDTYQSVSPLQGPANDAEDMADFLVEHAGFQGRDLRILLNGEATRDNILAEIESWLIQGTRPGDDALLYFSGHGFQQADLDGDETDGFDETLVPVDAWVDENGVARDMVTDDEIATLLDRLADRRVVVLVDACHSGTSTRAVRDGDAWRYVKSPRLPDGSPLRLAATRGVAGTVSTTESVVQSTHGNAVVWEAVRADQKALVDREAVDRPGSVFTRRLLAGAREKMADYDLNDVVTMEELHRYLLRESREYCDRYPADCLHGLEPQLQAAQAQMPLAAFEARQGVLPNSASLAKDLLVRPVSGAAGDVRLRIRPGSKMAIGDTLNIVVESDRSGFLTLFDIDAAGRLVQIFPNEPSLRSGVPERITPGRSITLPGADAGFEFRTTPPAGRGLLVAVVSEGSEGLAALTDRHKDLSVAPSPEAYLVEISEALYGGSGAANGAAQWSTATVEYELVSP